MTEELKQKAEAEADKVIIGSGMDRASVIHLKHLLVTMFEQGANLSLSQLTENDKQIEELKKTNSETLAELNHINGDLILEVAEKDKQIEELHKELADYQFNYPTIKELEAQIEKMKTELFAAYGRLSLAKALFTQWLHGGKNNINIVSDTQRFLEGEHER